MARNESMDSTAAVQQFSSDQSNLVPQKLYDSGYAALPDLVQQAEQARQKVQADLTPDKLQATDTIENSISQILGRLSPSEREATVSIWQKIDRAASQQERSAFESAMVDAVNDPTAKQQIKEFISQRDTALGPQLLNDLFQFNTAEDRIAANTPAQPTSKGSDFSPYQWNAPTGASASDGGKRLTAAEQDYDSHVDKLLSNSDKNTIQTAGHAVLEGNLSALTRAFKGNDEKLAALVDNVNRGLAAADSSMTLGTAPGGHVILRSSDGSKSIDIDTKKHTAVERPSRPLPDGTAAIDMASIVVGADANKDARLMAMQSLTGGGAQQRNAWSATGDSRPYYQSSQHYGPNPGQDTPGMWRSSAAAAVPEPSSIQQQTAAEKAVVLDQAFANAADPKEFMKQGDAVFQSLQRDADDEFKAKYAAKDNVDKQLDAAIPPEKRQQMMEQFRQLGLDMFSLPVEDQKKLAEIIGHANSDPAALEQWAMQHPQFGQDLKIAKGMLETIAPLLEKEAEIKLAAEDKVRVSMLYARDLAKAGDPRAKDAFNHAFEGLPDEWKWEYAQIPGVADIAEQLGLKLPAAPLQPRQNNSIDTRLI